jgi:hypothetical protein
MSVVLLEEMSCFVGLLPALGFMAIVYPKVDFIMISSVRIVLYSH